MYTFALTMFILMIVNLVVNIGTLWLANFPVEIQKRHCAVKSIIYIAIIIWATIVLFG